MLNTMQMYINPAINEYISNETRVYTMRSFGYMQAWHTNEQMQSLQACKQIRWVSVKFLFFFFLLVKQTFNYYIVSMKA